MSNVNVYRNKKNRQQLQQAESKQASPVAQNISKNGQVKQAEQSADSVLFRKNEKIQPSNSNNNNNNNNINSNNSNKNKVSNKQSSALALADELAADLLIEHNRVTEKRVSSVIQHHWKNDMAPKLNDQQQQKPQQHQQEFDNSPGNVRKENSAHRVRISSVVENIETREQYKINRSSLANDVEEDGDDQDDMDSDSPDEPYQLTRPVARTPEPRKINLNKADHSPEVKYNN